MNINSDNRITYSIATINLCTIYSQQKKQMLKDFIFANNIDILLLQEVAINDFTFITGYKAIVNNNEDLRGTTILIRDVISYSDVRFMRSVRGISIKVGNLRIVNVYAPSGSQNQSSREVFFRDDISSLFNASENLLIGGDFNCIVNDFDSTNPNYSSKSAALKQLISAFNLKDVWLVRNQMSRCYTYFHANTATRLDRFYLSENCTNDLGSCTVHPTPFTDHRAVVMGYKVNMAQCKNFFRHRRPWKLNNSVLDDKETNELFEENWNSWLKAKSRYPNTMSWWCLYVKQKIQNFLKWRSGIVYRNRKSRLAFYMSCLNETMNTKNYDNEVYVNIKKFKALILNEQRVISEGVKYRAKNYDWIHNESVSLFHVMKERKAALSKNINKIVYNGVEYEGTDGVNNAFYSFLNDIYDDNGDTMTNRSRHASDTERRVTQDMNDDLREPYSGEEVENSLKALAKNKSPGPDGLSLEFFIHFWKIIKVEITQLINDANSGTAVPKDFKRGSIILIPKNNNPKTVNEYRPISLLNVDYKLFMKCLKVRLQKHIPEFISKQQTCLDKKNNIFCTLNKLREEVVNANTGRKNRLLLGVDFDHAFDRVDHRYLWEVMQDIGFDQSFIAVIKNMYTDVTSTLQVNNGSTREIKVKSGVRQGCPLSMLLFAITMEPLLTKLKDSGVVALAYADDLSLVIKNQSDIETVKKCIDSYCHCSGSQLNIEKCKAVELGPQTMHAVESRPSKWFTVSSQIKILGIYFSNNVNQMVKENWVKITNQIRVILMSNKGRQLSIYQRAAFLNIYALSKAWYIAQILPIPVMVSRRIASLCGWFLWARLPCRVARATVTLAKSRGGLGIFDIWHKSNALLIQGIRRAINENIIKDLNIEKISNPPYPYSYTYQSPHVRRFLIEAAYIPNQLIVDKSATSKALYASIVNSQSYRPHIVTKTISMNINWSATFNNINASILGHTQKSLLYSIVHDTYPFNRKLYTMNRVNTKNCNRCGIAEDNLIHRFECNDQARKISCYILRVLQRYTHKCNTLEKWLQFDFRLKDTNDVHLVMIFLCVSVEYILEMPAPVDPLDYRFQVLVQLKRLKDRFQMEPFLSFIKCLKCDI